MTPNEAREEDNSAIVWFNLYGFHLEKEFKPQKCSIGQSVRISKYKKTFGKGYLPTFTEEIFKIKNIIFSHPIVHSLQDLSVHAHFALS
jgi:hypothetical protein